MVEVFEAHAFCGLVLPAMAAVVPVEEQARVLLLRHRHRRRTHALVGLIAGMQNDTKDRHVVAAAVKAGAQVVTTVNLKDFTPLPEGIEAQSPDEFLCNLFDLDPQSFIDMLRAQAADLHKPSVTFEELLERLFRAVPDLVGAVREHLATVSSP